jgi:hypothetical protein
MMDQMMGGGMMWGMGLIGLLVIIVLLLAAAALVKYIFSVKADDGSGIPEALARAAQRGVNVRLIAGKTTRCERKSGADLIVGAGASVWIDRGVRIAHSKTMSLTARSRWSAR